MGTPSHFGQWKWKWCAQSHHHLFHVVRLVIILSIEALGDKGKKGSEELYSARRNFLGREAQNSFGELVVVLGSQRTGWLKELGVGQIEAYRSWVGISNASTQGCASLCTSLFSPHFVFTPSPSPFSGNRRSTGGMLASRDGCLTPICSQTCCHEYSGTNVENMHYGLENQGFKESIEYREVKNKRRQHWRQDEEKLIGIKGAQLA